MTSDEIWMNKNANMLPYSYFAFPFYAIHSTALQNN